MVSVQTLVPPAAGGGAQPRFSCDLCRCRQQLEHAAARFAAGGNGPAGPRRRQQLERTCDDRPRRHQLQVSSSGLELVAAAERSDAYGPERLPLCATILEI